MPGYSAVNIPPFPRQARGCEIVLGKRLREEGGLQNEARGRRTQANFARRAMSASGLIAPGKLEDSLLSAAKRRQNAAHSLP